MSNSSLGINADEFISLQDFLVLSRQDFRAGGDARAVVLGDKKPDAEQKFSFAVFLIIIQDSFHLIFKALEEQGISHTDQAWLLTIIILQRDNFGSYTFILKLKELKTALKGLPRAPGSRQDAGPVLIMWTLPCNGTFPDSLISFLPDSLTRSRNGFCMEK